MRITRSSLIIIILSLIISIFFRVKIIEELPLGTNKTAYGLIGFDDEQAHLNYINYLNEYDSLPILKSKVSDTDAFKKNEFEYHQPPLYYWLVYQIIKGDNFDDKDILKLGRYINFIFYLLSIIILYLFIKELSGSEFVITGSITTFLLLGSTIYYSSLLSNDMLSWLLIWAVLWVCTKNINNNYLLISILIGLLHLTKFNVILIYPFLIYLIYQKRKKLKLKKVLILIFIPIMIGIPIYIRNIINYDTPFLIGEITGEKWQLVSTYVESLIRLKQAIYTFFFGMYFEPPKAVQAIYNYLFYFWFGSTMVYFLYKLKHIIREFSGLIVFLFINIIAFLAFAIPTGFMEGRQLFPSLPIIIYFLLLFLEKTFKKLKINKKLIPLILFLYLASLLIMVFFFIN
jgi:hypothetical protein